MSGTGSTGDGPLGFGNDDDAGTPPPAARDAAAPAQADAPQADPQTSRRRPSGPGEISSRYTWFIGVAAIVAIVYVTINSITTDGPGSRGAAVGQIAPPFAAPLVVNSLEKSDYVNVAVRTGDNGKAGKNAACSIHRKDVLTLCDLYATKPVLLAFVATHGGACARQLDTLQRIAMKRKDVHVAAIVIKADRGDARKFADGRGWTFPVAYDRDGILSTAYNVVICPEITYIRKGGRVAGTSFGGKSEAEVGARIDALLAGRPLPGKQ